MPIPTIPLLGLPWGPPATNITPFSYRDGMTYLQRLERIVRHIDKVVVPAINDGDTALAEAFSTELNELIGSVNEAIEALVSSSIEVQDSVIAANIENLETETYNALFDAFISRDRATRKYVIRPIAGQSDQASMQAGYDAGIADGILNFEIANIGRPWVLDNAPLNVHTANSVIDATKTEIGQTALNAPVFYVPPGSNGVVIKWNRLFLNRITRPAFSDMPTTGTIRGARSIANCSGVMSQAEYGYFEGFVEGFRNGVRLSHWDGVTSSDAAAQPALRRGNKVALKTDAVDFGLTYAGQNGLSGTVTGQYEHMLGTDDPGHLVYGTVHVDASININLTIEAYDSVKCGSAVSLKNNKDVKMSLYVKSCSSVINLQGMAGDITFTRLEGTDITGQMLNAAGDIDQYLEAVRSSTLTTPSFFPDLGKKIVLTPLTIDVREFPGTLIRVASLSNDWKLKAGHAITLNSEKVSTQVSAAVMHVYGNNCEINGGSIINRGGGKVNGINFAGGTSGHVMSDAGVMTGGIGIGVIFGADNGTYKFDPAAIRNNGIVRTHTVPGSVTGQVISSRIGKKRVNRWYTVPVSGADPVTHSMAAGTAFIIPVDFSSGDVYDTLAMTISTAQTGASIKLALYTGDEGGGTPNRFVADLGSIDASVAGDNMYGANNTSQPEQATVSFKGYGELFILAVMQGSATPVVVNGSHAGATNVGRPSLATAKARTSMVVTGITGAWPATVSAPVNGINTVPNVYMRAAT